MSRLPPPTAHPASRLFRAAKAGLLPVLLSALVLVLLPLPLLLAPAAPIGPQAAVARFQGDCPGAFSFTFDDAMPTQLIYAGPYLNRLGIKGTFFLITDIIADGEAGNPAVGKPTVWADWKALADSGHEIGSHTLSHPDLTTLPFEAAARQMTESALRIKEKLGITPVTFAFPFHGRNAALEKAALRTYIAVREARATGAGSADPLPLVVQPGRFMVQAVPGPGAITLTWTPAAAPEHPMKKGLPTGPLFSNSF